MAKYVGSANVQQYYQAHSTPFGSGPLLAHFGYKADIVGSYNFIKGFPLPEHTVANVMPETQLLLSSLQKMIKSNLPVLSNVITEDQFINTYKHLDEKTSSSPSGRHIGHYKAVLSSKHLPTLYAKLMSIPLMTGLSPPKW
jgi:hypothetical protein